MKALQKILFLFAVCLVIPDWTKAEYRAFLLQIKSPEEETPKLVKSSLDPKQYRGYYPLKSNETITYIDTWRCSGRTGGLLPICKSPKELAAEKAETDSAAGLPSSRPDETTTSKSPERKPANN